LFTSLIAEIGYRIAEHRCGQGLATLAVNRLIHEARTQWGLDRLVADVYVRNIGSAKVLQRAGFSIERVACHEHGEDRYLFARSI
jgi:ribosomal-protein-alanine N-acetyltransferase